MHKKSYSCEVRSLLNFTYFQVLFQRTSHYIILGKFELFKTVGQTFAHYMKGADSCYLLHILLHNCRNREFKLKKKNNGKIALKSMKKYLNFSKNILI